MRPKKILLVDDSLLILKMLSTFLKKNGYEVDTAQNGLEAIEKVYTNPPDIILLDITMPKMNGYQVCRLLKNDERVKYIPIIMFTTKDKPVEKFWGLQIGADAYVTKDIAYENLLNIIEKTLQKAEEKRFANINKPEHPVTLIDILLKTNDLLDKKLYEVTIINRITTLARDIYAYKKTINEVLSVLKELIDYSLAVTFIVDKEEGTLFVKSDNSPDKKDLMILQDYWLNQIEKYHLETPNHVKWIVLNQDEKVDEKKIIEDLDNFFFFYSGIKAGKGEVWGGFIFYGERIRELSESEETMLELILEHAFIIIENAYLYEKIRLKAVTDELTGLYNRRYFFSCLNQEYERAKRYPQNEFSVVMLDIDHFKRINDTYGHVAGDMVLRQLAKIMKESARNIDIPSRFGGEEFIILLPQTPLKGGISFAQRLRKEVESYPFEALGEKITVTISLGVSNYRTNMPYTVDEVIKRTDEALYKAKETGRNKVCVYEDDRILCRNN